MFWLLLIGLILIWGLTGNGQNLWGFDGYRQLIAIMFVCALAVKAVSFRSRSRR